MEEIKEADLAKSVENIFEKADEGEGMWKAVSKFAVQFDQLQIQALTKLTYVAETSSPKIRRRLLAFRDYYIELQNNRNTGLYIARIAELDSLKKYFTGIEGKVNIMK